jgi:hypothetical protein
MVSIDPVRTALVAIDMHRGHLDPEVARGRGRLEDSENILRRHHVGEQADHVV